KFLRERKKISQEALAEKLGITRAKLAALEGGQTKAPQPEDYINFSEYFKVSIDALLKVDLCKLTEFKLRELEAGNDVYMIGSKIRVLAISTDKQNNENIEYVPIKAKMGYKTGYNDPEYIAHLPKFSLPNLPRHKTIRIFPSTGESMLPIKPGTDFITEYVEDWQKLNDTPCVLILKSEGSDFVFKFVTWQKKDQNFLLRSLNDEYKPYTVSADEILEVWKYYKQITDELPEKEPNLQQIMGTLKEVMTKLEQLKN
ncbi:MAG TPA: helix-turn-helix transcriptional regulator, partial [Candidatus Babeliaceae bacterium]|nr:helix-turn-helix transcriptional regulator [Candidatus Babeliaceae bacterium]